MLASILIRRLLSLTVCCEIFQMALMDQRRFTSNIQSDYQPIASLKAIIIRRILLAIGPILTAEIMS